MWQLSSLTSEIGQNVVADILLTDQGLVIRKGQENLYLCASRGAMRYGIGYDNLVPVVWTEFGVEPMNNQRDN